MPSLRLFIAIETPPEIKPKIAAIRDQLRTSNADVKWEPDEKLHATMKFLGNTNEDLLPDFVSYIEGVGRDTAALLVKYAGLGCFPNRRMPRIIWVGIEDIKGNLAPLQHEIESGFTRFGFEEDERAFHPHVTLGRVKSTKRLDSLLRMMESITFESQTVEIREVALIKSELKPSGSLYTTLKTIPLAK
jgi:2'-5' RNA ligase